MSPYPSPLGVFSYDTVLLALVGVRPPDLKTKLREPVVSYDAAGGRTVKGWLGPAWVLTNPVGLFVRVSLPRYLFDTNAQPLPPRYVLDVVDRVGRDLGLTAQVVRAARVYRADVCVNLATRHTPDRYVDGLLDVPRMQRLPFGDGCTFVNSRRQLAFYDKVREIKSKSGHVPDGLSGAHVLRYEHRLKRNLAAQMGGPVYAEDLAAPRVFGSFVRQAVARFATVQVRRSVVVPPITGPSAVREWLEAVGLETVGLPNVIAAIDADRASGRVDSVSASRARARARATARSPPTTATDDLMRELTLSIRGAAKRTLAAL